MEEPISTPAETEPQTTEAAAAPASEPQQPQTSPSNGGEDQQPGASEPTKEPTAAEPSKGPRSLLDEEAGAEAKPASQEPGANATPGEEDIKKFCEAIPALDLGDGVKWEDSTLKEMAPELIAISGGDPKKAEPLVKKYAAYAQKVAKQQQESEEAFATGLIKECEKEYGADLPRYVRLANIGGQEAFGDEIWREMRKVAAFANNPKILGRLAKIGQRYSKDGGKVSTKDGDPAPDSSDVLHRMYGGVKV